MIHIVGDALCTLAGGIFLLGDRGGEGGHDLRPRHLAGVAYELLFGMGGKGTRIDGHPQHRHTVVAGCITGLLVESGGSYDDCRDAQFLSHDA